MSLPEAGVTSIFNLLHTKVMDPASSVSLCTRTVVHYNIAACVNVCMPRGGNSRGRGRGGAETWHSRVTLSSGENQMNRLRTTGHAAVVQRADYSSGATAWWSHRHRRKTAPEAWSCTAELRTHPPQPVSHQPATEQELMATMAAAILDAVPGQRVWVRACARACVK